MSVATKSSPKSFFREPSLKRETRHEPESARKEAPLLSEYRITEFKSNLSDTNKTKVARIVDAEMSRAGYSSYRPGSRTHLQIEQRVISNLVAHEVDLDEINFEDDSESKK
jgi:hypothetical protein